MRVSVVDMEGNVLWDQQLESVPKEGDAVIFRDPTYGRVTREAIVRQVRWWLTENDSKAEVQVFVELIELADGA